MKDSAAKNGLPFLRKGVRLIKLFLEKPTKHTV
jgi:hypothetical protein